jgi:predicted helicase
MNRTALQAYFKAHKETVLFSGQRKEGTTRHAFEGLLRAYAEPHHLRVVPEYTLKTTQGNTIFLDGVLLNVVRKARGHWEAKDEFDDLGKEIEAKRAKGYPFDNILFEDGQRAILFQNKVVVLECPLLPTELECIDHLLTTFVQFTPPEEVNFNKALAKFREELPDILVSLREMIAAASQHNAAFQQQREAFLRLIQQAIDPALTVADAHEMLLQHILTDELFRAVISSTDNFHRENAVALALETTVNTFFTGPIRRATLKAIHPFYAEIEREAKSIGDHRQKQDFLKVLYETFYKAYNPKAADRLGVVYTPTEVVRFMLAGTDHLLDKHFNKLLADPGVQILDPATGTGTFITELIDYLPRHALRHKYEHEIHANEVGLLPYYIATLNIEYTFEQKMGDYLPFQHSVLVDTLENTGFGFVGKQTGLDFGALEENQQRIQAQNQRKISVIIGNPPYNANQQNENDNNKNKAYPAVDARIKATYVKESTAQKTKVYDMYARFFRWASDRIGDEGIVAFITNSSFVHSRTFDGFRKVVADEFDEIWVVDLGGDVRKNPKLSGTTHNVFGIQTGVAVCFMVRKPLASTSAKRTARIYYSRRPEDERADSKLQWLSYYRDPQQFKQLDFERITPDAQHYWLNLTDNDEWDGFIPVANKKTKLAKSGNEETAVFKLISMGVLTARDEWSYDYSIKNLKIKAELFCKEYSNYVGVENEYGTSIKWTSELKDYAKKKQILSFSTDKIIDSAYRPYTKKAMYFDNVYTHRIYQNESIFPIGKDLKNVLIAIDKSGKPFNILATDCLPDYHYNGDSACLPRYRYTKDGQRVDNITDWALAQFQAAYAQEFSTVHTAPRVPLSKDAIFHYTYAVLHHPQYREQYAQNLKRDFPRLPFYPNFCRWAAWGAELMALHLHYETAPPLPGIVRHDKSWDKPTAPKPKLKADKAQGIIYLDEQTQLTGFPPTVWDYKLGNRTALEWVLDQHKEKTPQDATIRERFNTYRFADYKEHVIDLLLRVAHVSVETVRITTSMSQEPGGSREQITVSK